MPKKELRKTRHPENFKKSACGGHIGVNASAKNKQPATAEGVGLPANSTNQNNKKLRLKHHQPAGAAD